jgi:hypothetical protein
MNVTVRLPENRNNRRVAQENKRASANRLLVARILIGIVLFLNLQCALVFIGMPDSYAQGFGLSGESGNVMVQALGVLFVMWNVPYAVALLHPQKHRLSLLESVVMQSIGLAGEASLLIFSPGISAEMNRSITRFIFFDSLGLVLLLLASWFARHREMA